MIKKKKGQAPEFTLDWPHGHKTRSGEKVRILCHDLKGDQPIVIVREDREGREYLEKRYSNGVMFEDYKNGLDIINAPMECISYRIAYILVKEGDGL